MRPTTKDLARAAGVSLATVDRVLNGRAGVRAGTVEKVNAAVARLGFVRNASAATLGRGRPLRVRFLLPRAGGAFLRSIEAAIADAARAFSAEMLDVGLDRIDADDPHAVARALGALTARDADAVALMAPETPEARDALLNIDARGVVAVALGAAYDDAEAVLGVHADDRAAGATAARLIGRFTGGRGRVLVVGDTLLQRRERERRFGFDQTLRRAYPGLRPSATLEAHGDPARAARIAATAAQSPVAGVYLLSSEVETSLAAVSRAVRPNDGAPPPPIVAHERTPVTEAALRGGRLAAVIAQDPGHWVRSAVRRARARISGAAPFVEQETLRIQILVAENL